MRNLIEQKIFLYSTDGSKCVIIARETKQRIAVAQYRQSRALNDAKAALAVWDRTDATLATEDAEAQQHTLRHTNEVLCAHAILSVFFNREQRRDVRGQPIPNRHERRHQERQQK